MKAIATLIVLLTVLCAKAQTPVLTLSPRGFEPVSYTTGRIDDKKFADLSKAWVTELKRRDEKFDLSNVSSSSLTISGLVKNAFFYRNRGETFQHKAKLVMKVDFTATGYTLTVSIPEIYGDNDTPSKYTLPDYFNSSGNLKEGYDGLQASVEDTVNDIALNYYNFITNYK